MVHVPNYVGRTETEIISENIYFDGPGYIYRAMSWLDYATRTGQFSTFHYACVDARLGIECLFFDMLVICTYPNFNEEYYQDCVKNPTKLDKILRQREPDYIRLQEFANIIATLSPDSPSLSIWNLKDLRKSWGIISQYLHWIGATSETIDNSEWKCNAIKEITCTVKPIWQKITSGRIGAMQIETMPQPALDIWRDYKSGTIDAKSAKIRLEIVKPLLD